MRLLWIFLALAMLFLIPFLIWGASLEEAFSVESAITWLTAFERWAWAAAIGLLLLDFLLPIPATAVMSALGYIYGPLWGGLIGGGGSLFSGLAAYGLCRWLGPKAAERLLGERDYQRGRKLFAGAGGWIIVISRWLPLLPEVVACMAGLTRMPIGKLVLAMACGDPCRSDSLSPTSATLGPPTPSWPLDSAPAYPPSSGSSPGTCCAGIQTCSNGALKSLLATEVLVWCPRNNFKNTSVP